MGLHYSRWMRDWSQRWLSSQRLNDELWRHVCLFFTQTNMPLLDSFPSCVDVKERRRERNTKVVELKPNDVTRHQLTIDFNLTNTLPPRPENSAGAYQKPSGTMCPLQGRLVIYCGSRDIVMELNVKPKCQKASVCPVLRLSSLHSHGRQRERRADIYGNV